MFTGKPPGQRPERAQTSRKLLILDLFHQTRKALTATRKMCLPAKPQPRNRPGQTRSPQAFAAILRWSQLMILSGFTATTTRLRTILATCSSRWSPSPGELRLMM